MLTQVCGMEHLATADPLNSFTVDDSNYHSEPSYICRFALGVAVYLVLSLLQVVFWCGIYTNLVEDHGNFKDEDVEIAMQ